MTDNDQQQPTDNESREARQQQLRDARPTFLQEAKHLLWIVGVIAGGTLLAFSVAAFIVFAAILAALAVSGVFDALGNNNNVSDDGSD